MKTYLITGGCGFLGSNLAREVLHREEKLVVFDSLFRTGSVENLAWLRSFRELEFVHGDIRNTNDVNKVVRDYKPDVIFHLAGQVTMTLAVSDPRRDFETNALGTFNLLEAVRQFTPEALVVYSSTNKVYGDLEELNYKETDTRYELPDYPKGLPEGTPLAFASPYGCSKGAADQYILDYHKIYGLNTVVFRHSSMYGGRQFSSFDQGWVGWFVEQAVKTVSSQEHSFTISGNGKQVRDVLHAEDMIKLYFSTVSRTKSIAGEVFNIGGGSDTSLSLLELFSMLERKLGVKLNYTKLPPRSSDQKVFMADISKAKKMLDWTPEVSAEQGIDVMIDWVKSKPK